MSAPSPQQVGREFVRQYYTLLHEAPLHLHRFYSEHSTFTHGGIEKPGEEEPPAIGQHEIHKKITALNFRDCHTKIQQVDSHSTLGSGVVVQVTGELSNNRLVTICGEVIWKCWFDRGRFSWWSRMGNWMIRLNSSLTISFICMFFCVWFVSWALILENFVWNFIGKLNFEICFQEWASMKLSMAWWSHFKF